MYINPVLFGVIMTLLVETAIILLWSEIRGKDDEDSDDKSDK